MALFRGENTKFITKQEFQSISASLSFDGASSGEKEGLRWDGGMGKQIYPLDISFPTPILNFMWGI